VCHEDFLSILQTIREVYDVKLVPIHSQKGLLEEALAKLKVLEYKLSKLELTLAYENFYPTKRVASKWIYLAEDMWQNFNLPFLKITYDCAHSVVNGKTLAFVGKNPCQN
jgi:hypothetical protein